MPNRGLLVVLLLLLLLPVPGTAVASDNFFPIGMWEAQRVPTACGGADSTALDEIRGSQELGYISGINAVFCYFHADLNFLLTTPEQVECYLDEAAEFGFKALIRLSETKTFGPAPWGSCCWDTTCSGYEGEYWVDNGNCNTLSNYPSLYERNPPDTTDHAAVIRKVAGHEALLAFYLADEPQRLGCAGVSAAALIAARETYRTLDDAYPGGDAPYYISLFDYEESKANSDWTDLGTANQRMCDWFWDGGISQVPHAEGCGPAITPDYSNVGDVIMYDNYRTDNELWRHELGQFDDLVSGGKEVQAILPYYYPLQWQQPAPPVTPTASQLRLQAYGDIIHGAKGIWFFSYSRMYPVPRVDIPGWVTAWAPGGDSLYTVPPEEFVENIVPLSNELANIIPFLEGTTASTYWQDATPCGSAEVTFGSQMDMAAASGDMQYMLKYANAENLLIAMNASADSTSVTFDLASLSSADSLVAPARAALAAHRINEPASVVLDVNNGTFTDNFQPWSVHVYLLRAPRNRNAAQ